MSELTHGYANKREQYLVLNAFHFYFSPLLPFDGLGYYSIRQMEENTHARTQRQRLFRLSLVFSTEEISVRMNGGRENGEEGSQSLNLISSSLKKKKSFE